MAIVIPNDAEILWLKHGLGAPRSSNQFLQLYVNDIAPDEDSIGSDFTEAFGGGYVERSLSPTLWTISPIFDGGEATRSPVVKFTFAGPLDNNDTIFGWLIVAKFFGGQLGDRNLLAVERFTNPFTPNNNGDILTVPVKFEMTNDPDKTVS